MGNKQGKLEGRDGTSDSKKKRTARSASAHDLATTQNDQGRGGNATTSPFVRDFRGNCDRPGFKRYQSYGGPSSHGSSKPHGGSPSDGGKSSYLQNPVSAPTGGRYRSLPRNPGARNRSQSVTSNGEPVDADGHVTYKRYAHIPASGSHSNPNGTISRPSATGPSSAYSGVGAGYRHGSNYRVVSDDFPDTATIKRCLAQFETQFEKCFNVLFSRLDDTLQLDCVPLALRLDATNARRHRVSLYQYLTSGDVPQDLNDPQQTAGRERYVLAVPEALFQDARRIRSQRVRDRARWLALAKEIAGAVVVDVAEELSRMFEYQIALLGDGAPVDLLAGHAVQSAVEYVKAGSGFLERSALIAGVLGGGPPASSAARVFSVFAGGSEFKWNLSEIFKKCGLRKETLLFGPRSRDSTKFVPWTHLESAASSAHVYGYRGIALDRDPVHGFYVVAREDELQFAGQTVQGRHPNDVHTRYCPYRRLIGKEVMDEYCRSTKDTANVTLGEYVSRLQGYERSRDAVQPVYRPLGMVSGLAKGSRIGTSVSSLLSPPSAPAYAGGGAAATSRATGGRYDERERRPRSQFAVNGEQVQTPGASTVYLRNNSTSSPNGHAQRFVPRTGLSAGERGYKSESCSVASEDFGDEYGGYERGGGGGGGGGGGDTFARHDPHQQRRLYQSQRPHSSKSVSTSFNPDPGSYNYGRPAGSSTSPIYAAVGVNSRPGPGFDQTHTVNRGSTTGRHHGPPKSPDSGFVQTTLSRGSTLANQNQKPELEIGNSVQRAKDREFLDFNAFLGMVKQGENDEVVSEINTNDKSNSTNGHYGTAKYDLGSTGPRRIPIGAFSYESNNLK